MPRLRRAPDRARLVSPRPLRTSPTTGGAAFATRRSAGSLRRAGRTWGPGGCRCASGGRDDNPDASARARPSPACSTRGTHARCAREVDALLAGAARRPTSRKFPIRRLPRRSSCRTRATCTRGPIAAIAYAPTRGSARHVRRVVARSGPPTVCPLDGLAVPSVDALRTPLGDVPIDADLRDRVVALPHVTIDDGAHVR